MNSRCSKDVLTKEQQKYVHSQIMDTMSYANLLFGIVMIFTKQIPFVIFGIFMVISFLSSLNFARKFNKGELGVVIGCLTDKYEKDARPHPTSGKRNYRAVLSTDDGNVIDVRIPPRAYLDVERGEKIIILTMEHKNVIGEVIRLKNMKSKV